MATTPFEVTRADGIAVASNGAQTIQIQVKTLVPLKGGDNCRKDSLEHSNTIQHFRSCCYLYMLKGG